MIKKKEQLTFLWYYLVLLQTSDHLNYLPFLYSNYFRSESETDLCRCLILNTKWDYKCA